MNKRLVLAAGAMLVSAAGVAGLQVADAQAHGYYGYYGGPYYYAAPYYGYYYGPYYGYYGYPCGYYGAPYGYYYGCGGCCC